MHSDSGETSSVLFPFFQIKVERDRKINGEGWVSGESWGGRGHKEKRKEILQLRPFTV